MKFLANIRDTITSVRSAVRERIDVNYTTASTDPNLSEVAVNGDLTAWQNEDGSYRAQIPTHKLWDSPFRAISRTSQTGLHWVVQNEARDTDLFGVDPVDGQVTRSGVKYTSLKTSSIALSGASSPAVYGVKLLTTQPETALTAGTTLASQSLYLMRVEVLQPTTVSTGYVYVSQAAVTPAANYNGIALYSESGNTLTLVGSTPDDTTLFTTTGWRSKNFSTPIVLTPGMYWVAVMNRATTAMQVRSSQSISSSNILSGLPAGSTTVSIATQTSFPSSLDKSSWTVTNNTVRALMALN